MKVVVNARFGTVLESDMSAYYVPTRTPSSPSPCPAQTETLPELNRTNVWSPTAEAGEYVAVPIADLLYIDGVIPFSGGGTRAVSRAEDWAQLEELVGPLRYRHDVEDAGMYFTSRTYRPRIPLRVARHGLGAMSLYLTAHNHNVLHVKKALGLTYHELTVRIAVDVYPETPSFEWEGPEYE